MTLDLQCKRAWQTTQPEQAFGADKSPLANLGLLLFEKNLIGVTLLLKQNTTMFVSLNFFFQATEFAMLYLFKKSKTKLWLKSKHRQKGCSWQ